MENALRCLMWPVFSVFEGTESPDVEVFDAYILLGIIASTSRTSSPVDGIERCLAEYAMIEYESNLLICAVEVKPDHGLPCPLQ